MADLRVMTKLNEHRSEVVVMMIRPSQLLSARQDQAKVPGEGRNVQFGRALLIGTMKRHFFVGNGLVVDREVDLTA